MKNIVSKPWGSEKIIFEKNALYSRAVVKILTIKAHQKLSKQYHHVKEEMLVCLEGEGIFEIDGKQKKYQEGFRIFIPAGTEHRLSATTNSKFIELSSGFDEDIVRIEDDYGRI